MRSFRPILALSGTTLLALAPLPAHAQLDDRTVVSILRECRAIADAAARAACYDNIPLGQTNAAARPQPSAPAANAAPRAGFGSDQLPPQRAAAKPAEPDRVTATLAAAVERQPGSYLLTLEGGAQWEFVDTVSIAYDPPRAGSQIEIQRAALGSYLMRYAGQRAVRIRRVR